MNLQIADENIESIHINFKKQKPVSESAFKEERLSKFTAQKMLIDSVKDRCRAMQSMETDRFTISEFAKGAGLSPNTVRSVLKQTRMKALVKIIDSRPGINGWIRLKASPALFNNNIPF